MRVRIAEAVRSVAVEGTALRVAERPVGLPRVEAVADGRRVRVGSVVSKDNVSIEAEDGLAINGREVPGALSLVPGRDGSLDVVNLVPLEAYVARSVAGEVYSTWPEEVLKAQAVVARTYALHERSRNLGQAHDLDSSVLSQRYVDGAVSPRVTRAALETRAEFLAYEGDPILAAFHSSAGGHTASSEEVWGESRPYLRSVRSPDDNAPNYFWTYEIGLEPLGQALRDAGYPARGTLVRVASRTSSGRVAELQFGRARVSGRDLRQILGGAAIRSALFDVRVEDHVVRFLGSGSGHGVGLCQWGAHEMAVKGSSYREILAHYYPGTRLERLDHIPLSSSRWGGQN